jgi:hypothetical protein
MGHQVDNAVNNIFHATGEFDIAFTGPTAVVLAPAQTVPVQCRNAVYRCLGDTFQQSWAGEIGAKGEVVDLQKFQAW